MITLQEVERQLEAIGSNYRYWGRAEVIELQHILVPGEQIQACLNGRYHGGFATFVATDQRLLLVDKKIFYLTVEDMRYDMIAEVDFGAQLLSGTIRVCTPTKTLTFTSFRPKALRQVASYIQQHVMEVRHRYEVQQAPETVPSGMTQLVAPAPEPQQPQPTPAFRNAYTTILGNQALNGSEAESLPEAKKRLPLPQRNNPYMSPPLMVRRRIGRFGPIGTPHAPVN